MPPTCGPLPPRWTQPSARSKLDPTSVFCMWRPFVGESCHDTQATARLYGIFVHQAYRYVRTYRMDCTLIKGFVGTMMVLETFHVILCMHVCYFYLATNYLNSDRLLRGVWSINLLPATTGSAIFVSQAFFARRVYLISPRYRLLVAAAIVLSFVELGFAIAATVESFRMPSFIQFWGVTWTVSAAFGAAVASDVLLTGVLIYVLHSSRTAFGRTDSIIDGLITYSTNTGLLISVFNVLSLIFALILPDNLIYAGIMIVATNLYANSLLAVLNTRQVLAERAMDRFEPTSFRIEKASAHGRSRNSEAEQWHVPQVRTTQ
ncbi:hypothetical protein BD413DRAFT_583680 [Trametes elegans]|nr:hypothetical protein BD413DRAFT_583680 [Trametes elegans]